jgi:Fuc2NAc and GlcNAc transferase
LIILLSALLATLVLEYLTLLVTRRLALVAVPNERSSHQVPTPSLGGVAIAVPVLVYLGYQASAGVEVAAGLGTGCLLLALIGLWDDLREAGSLVRLLCHLAAAGVVLLLLDLNWPLLMLLGAGFLLVWQVNLFNFMDGIDGIAGVQVLVYCVGVLLVSGGIPGWLGELIWLLCGCTVGFLAFNWPPAKIFMGDVGSGFLGLLLGFLVLVLAVQGYVPLVGSLILLAVFWFDASYTLCVRIVTGQRFVSAHRSHLYQKLAQRRGHGWTTSVYALFGAFWLVPLAVCSVRYPDWLLVWLLLALAPIAVACVWLRAGLTEAIRKS